MKFSEKKEIIGRRGKIIVVVLLLALPSTAKEFSRIVPVFKTGAVVTASRNDVDYVVTDIGVAALSGKTYRERMKAIIQIAHPKFQEELAKKAFEIYNVRI